MPLIRHRAAADPAPAAPSYEELLADLTCPDEAARRSAARWLGDYPQSAQALSAALSAEPRESVRAALFTALIRIHSPAAAQGLIPLLAGEDVGLRNGAIEALAAMPAAVSPLIPAMMAGPTDVRLFAVDIVRALPHLERRAWLLDILARESEVNVCIAAVDALVDCGDEHAVAPLAGVVARFPNEPVLAFSVRTALAQIASSS